MNPTKVLILGVTGMLGHTLFNELSRKNDLEVFGTARGLEGSEKGLLAEDLKRIRTGVDAEKFDTLVRSLASFRPDIVVNCIGLIKQSSMAQDPLSAITVNAQLPHRISLISTTAGSRMIHISTDCVFDGKKGNYNEQDCSDATDLYGRTKYLGEVSYPHCVTLRTSIIGHELKNKFGLVEWFLGQEGTVNGFTKAIYSGFPTVELARILMEYIIPNPELSGLYHVSSDPISKYDLLNLISKRYDKKIKIEPYDGFLCDRSLDSTVFRKKTGYTPPTWSALVDQMYTHHVSSNNKDKRYF